MLNSTEKIQQAYSNSSAYSSTKRLNKSYLERTENKERFKLYRCHQCNIVVAEWSEMKEEENIL
jgi:hypothetical protein